MVGRTKRRTWAAGLVAACLVATACSSSGGSDAAKPNAMPAGVTWERNESKALRNVSGAADVYSATTLPSGTMLAGGRIQEPGKATFTAAVWQSKTGSDWSRVEAGATTDGGAVNGLSVDGTTAVAVGSAVKGDAYVARAWTRSADGRWHSLAVHDPGDASELFRVAAGDSSTTAVGIDELHGKRRLVVGTAKTGKPLDLQLGPDAEDPAVYDIAKFAGKTWIAGAAKVDGIFRQVLWSAPDDGGPWTAQVVTDISDGDAFGALEAHHRGLWAAGTWTAADGTRRCGLWDTTDGNVWQRVPIHVDTASTSDHEPPGGASALAGNDDGLMLGCSQGDALWIPDGSTTGYHWSQPASMALATEVDAIAAGPHSVTSFSGLYGTFAAASVDPATPTPNWKDVTPEGVPADTTNETVDAILNDSSAYGSRSNQAMGADQTGTVRGPELNFVDLSGAGNLAPVDSDLISVAGLERDGERTIAVGGADGSRTKTGGTSDYNDIGVGQADGDHIKTLSTFGGPKEQTGSTILHVGKDWWIGGHVEQSTQTRLGEAAIWHSTDLKSWKPEKGAFTGGDRRFVLHLCAGLGTEWAVGSEIEPDQTVAGMVWKRGKDGTWDEAKRSPGQTYLGCAGDTNGLVIPGGNERVTSSSDGKTFATRSIAPGSYELAGSIVRTPHGYAMAGTKEDHLLRRVVIWTSPDGSRWTLDQAPTGSSEGLYVADIRPVGHDLVVAGSDGLDGMFWRVHGLPL